MNYTFIPMMKTMKEWAAPDWMAAFSFWRPVASMAADGEAALFAVLAERLSTGHLPDIMNDTEEALERLSHERGFGVMSEGVFWDGAARLNADPVYFDRLERSRTVLLDLAEGDDAVQQIGLLMDCLYAAFDLGTGRALADGAQAMRPQAQTMRY